MIHKCSLYENVLFSYMMLLATLQKKHYKRSQYIYNVLDYNIKSESPDRETDVQTVTFTLLSHPFYFIFFIFKIIEPYLLSGKHLYTLIFMKQV